MMEGQSAGTAQHRMNQIVILLTYLVSQGTGREWRSEQDNIDPGQEALRTQSHNPWGKREEQPLGSELGAAKIEVIC